MKTQIVQGVECAEVMWTPELTMACVEIAGDDNENGACSLCPLSDQNREASLSGCGTPCGLHYLVPLRYIPILQMRGVQLYG